MIWRVRIGSLERLVERTRMCDQIRRVVAAFVRWCVLVRWFVRVGYCVLKFVVDVECSRGTVRECGGVDEGVAIE